jgi:hypothetical protein
VFYLLAPRFLLGWTPGAHRKETRGGYTTCEQQDTSTRPQQQQQKGPPVRVLFFLQRATNEKKLRLGRGEGGSIERIVYKTVKEREPVPPHFSDHQPNKIFVQV